MLTAPVGGYHWYDIGHLVPLGGADINLADTTARWRPGQQGYFNDQLGARYAKCIKNISGGAVLQGTVMSKAGDANGHTAIASILTGSTTHLTTTGLTAGFHEGALIYVNNHAAVAGGAPETEIAIARTNSATRMDFQLSYPLSAALAVTDAIICQAQYCAEKAASGDNAWAVLGTVLAMEGIPNNAYGWVQQKGRCRVVTVNTITAAVGTQAMVSATAGQIDGVAAGTTFVDIIGYFFLPISFNDIVNDYGWIDIRCDEYCGGASTLDATA